MPEIKINVSKQDYRVWEYYLQKKYNSKAKLPTLARLAIQTEVAASAKEELAAARKDYKGALNEPPDHPCSS